MAGTSRREAVEDLDAPWCIEVIHGQEWRPLASRENSTNQLFADTLWTDKTIRAHQSFYKQPPVSQAFGGELRVLLSFGPGLDGYPGMCHGGLLTLIFDDAIHELAALEIPEKAVTVTLSVNFRRPVLTPAVVLCRAWMEKEPQGRKGWVKATIEDGKGGVHASAEGFILKMKQKL